jgi:hypothetical protein
LKVLWNRSGKPHGVRCFGFGQTAIPILQVVYVASKVLGALGKATDLKIACSRLAGSKKPAYA